ncbi:hypothetical protein [Micromonospora sp. U21]|uniref:hypothetical protein n=1 Tax=Micromonospora sp. U21 TaxID=2824899 RepID=UPI001B3606D6|nr:hypothetical protein [Micromonospora sp. U21]MBQ0904112.1 hypothetical protein [Micromonospora sp. U21]
MLVVEQEGLMILVETDAGLNISRISPEEPAQGDPGGLGLAPSPPGPTSLDPDREP